MYQGVQLFPLLVGNEAYRSQISFAELWENSFPSSQKGDNWGEWHNLQTSTSYYLSIYGICELSEINLPWLYSETQKVSTQRWGVQLDCVCYET